MVDFVHKRFHDTVISPSLLPWSTLDEVELFVYRVGTCPVTGVRLLSPRLFTSPHVLCKPLMVHGDERVPTPTCVVRYNTTKITSQRPPPLLSSLLFTESVRVGPTLTTPVTNMGSRKLNSNHEHKEGMGQFLSCYTSWYSGSSQ